MGKWDIGDAYEAIFGDHYANYKDYMRKIEHLNELRERVDCELMNDNHGTLGRRLLDIRHAYQNLADNLDTKNYGWKGKDMDACWRKALELRDEMREVKRGMRRAGESILAGLEEERGKYCRAALREIENFSVTDRITSTVDVTAQEIKRRLEDMVRSL